MGVSTPRNMWQGKQSAWSRSLPKRGPDITSLIQGLMGKNGTVDAPIPVQSNNIPPVSPVPSQPVAASPAPAESKGFLGLSPDAWKMIGDWSAGISTAARSPGISLLGSIGQGSGYMNQQRRADEATDYTRALAEAKLAAAAAKDAATQEYRNRQLGISEEKLKYQKERNKILKNKSGSTPEEKDKIKAYYKLLESYEDPLNPNIDLSPEEKRKLASEVTGYNPDGATKTPAPKGTAATYTVGDKTLTDDDILETTKKYNMSPEEVKRQLGIE